MATAQEMSGQVHSNHAGTNVLFFNPAGMHHQKNWLSINIFTMDMFFSNNYAYIPKEDFSFTNLDFPMHKTDYSFGERPFYIYDKGHKTRADLHLKLQGPSVMYIYNQHAFAITSGARAITTMKNLSQDLGRLIYHGFHYSPQYEDDFPIENFRGSVLNWGEIGFSYAYQHNTRSFGNWNFGMSIRKLYSAGGGYLYVDNTGYNLHNDSTLEFKPLNAEMAFSGPMDYHTNELIPGLAVYGKGWGFDVGIEYQELIKRQGKHLQEKVCGQSYNNYKYRWGISITDIGYITFANNAQLHQYIDVNYLWENIDTVKYDNLNDAVHDISNRFYGDPQASLKDTKFKIWLPTSINASFDYNFENDFYLNSSIVFSAPLMMSNYIEKPAIFSITPRYEKQNIEASLSLNLYQWQYPRVGASLRLYYFTIGSDYLTSLLGVHDFNGMDLYFSFKINIGKGSCTKRNTINPCGDDGKYFPWSK
ncbi:MAG: hypothetical protein KAH25_00735 [Bacteroidales bacterium]|nr:hypothetical protein [Bacteroidales bacterium]